MEIAATQQSTPESNVLTVSGNAQTAENQAFLNSESGRSSFELGLWLSGLDSFLNFPHTFFAEENRAAAGSRDLTREFRLTHSALLLCAKLIVQLENKLAENDSPVNSSGKINLSSGSFELKSANLRELSHALKDVLLINETLLRAAPLKFGEWKAWRKLLSEKLQNAATFSILIEIAEKAGKDFLPEILRDVLSRKTFCEQSDLHLILPRFAKILRWLSIVGEMLERDEPLKPVILIFSRVYEQTQEMIQFINNRLLHLPDEESELFGTLDGAAYTASIELKKVYTQELIGLIGIRPTPAVYAKIETAYSLLNDSFQQTLISFARLIEPSIAAHEIFPNFEDKRANSLILRRDLWQTLKSVQQTEQNPDQYPLAELNRQLAAFSNKSLHFLFYKDKETIERFIEEILITADKKDLMPILHRFGAYLETLFGQVNIRAVLIDYPFEPQE